MTPADVPVLSPPVELTDASLGGFMDEVRPFAEGTGPGLVLDLERVTFINSTGLGCLVKLGMRLDKQKRRFALARPDRKIERTIRLIGLDSKLPLFRTLEEAADFVFDARAPHV